VTILFDLDGTLIDSTEAILESFGVSFKEFDLKIPSDDVIKSFIGYPLEIMYKELGIKTENIADIVAIYKKHYREISRKKTTLLLNAKEALEEASKFAVLGVVTTKTKRYSLELLEYMDILRYFKVIIGREDVQNPKPHPEPILKAMDILDAKIEKTWMIGDTRMDIESAKGANIQHCAVLCGYGNIDELTMNGNLIFLNTLEAIKYIQKL